jgi:flagellar hook-associated protein 1 FlgK
MLQSLDSKTDVTPHFKGTFEEYVVSVISDISVQVEYLQDMKDTSESVLNTISDERESIMGVSTDEESINLVKYQKSYNAAARVMTALDEILDVLINKTGIVGR